LAVPREIEPVYERLGVLVRNHRSRLEMSQETLGRSLEPPMTRASVANIESGQQRVFLHTAMRLSSVLGFDLGEAIAEVQGSKPNSKELASELAEKLPMSASRARSLAQRIAGKEKP
jgi:ribosome-binding protein aMBF1 (putative translation factor)